MNVINPWNERYAGEDYVFGTRPNEFLVEAGPQIPKGRVLCIGEGEGRNAVFLASLGFEVTAVDGSAVGLEKARRLAEERGVTICTEVADLADYVVKPEHWSGIVSIFCHLPSFLRHTLYPSLEKGLIGGGALLLEAYTPEQPAFGTGGPSDPDLLLTSDELRQTFSALTFERLTELERDVTEGNLHTGRAAVVQMIARKSILAKGEKK